MARPTAKILRTASLDDGSTWDILHTDSYYVVTYQGRPCGIRQHKQMSLGFKYMKLSYTNLGNARAQAHRLNKKFACNDFDVMEVI